MYREEVIAKALREYRDRLKVSLDANKTRQRELIDTLAEHQLALETLSNLVKGKQTVIEKANVEPRIDSEDIQLPKEKQVETVINNVSPTIVNSERRAYSREKLKSVAFPVLEMQLSDESFEVSRVRELLDNLEPEVKHTYEAAWNLCNDLLREGKLRQAGIRKGEKGVVRLFQLKKPGGNNRSNHGKGPALAGG